MSIPTETISFEGKTWKFSGHYFAGLAIYENGYDWVLVNDEGKVEKTAYYFEGVMRNVLEDIE